MGYMGIFLSYTEYLLRGDYKGVESLGFAGVWGPKLTYPASSTGILNM